MRRLAVITFVLLIQLQGGPVIGARQQTDSIATLLGDFEAALNSGQIEDFISKAAPALPAGQRRWLTELAPASGATTATVRERARSTASALVDVFIAQGTQGFVASWLLTFAPPDRDDAVRIQDITEVWRFDDLVRVWLDVTRQFAVTDLVVRGPDYTLQLPSGVVFMAEAAGRRTGLVILGQATVRFTPSDPAEQGQLRIFGGELALTENPRRAFVRLNPEDFTDAVSWTRSEPVAVEAAARSSAQRIFDDRATRGVEIDLSDLTSESWSIRPASGSLRVDFETRRHGWLTYAHSPGRIEDVSLVDDSARHLVSSYRSPGSNAATSTEAREPYEVTATDVDVSFDPGRLWLSGRTSVTLRMRETASSVSFRLARTLVVSSVSSSELGRLLPLRPSDRDVLLVGLPAAVPAGETITVDVQYHGRLNPQQLDVPRPGTTAVDPIAPEPFLLVTTPRFLYSNESGWYPQPAIGQYAPATLRLTIPADHEVVATGRRVDAVISDAVQPFSHGGQRVETVTYRADRPVRYLSFLVAELEPLGTAVAQVPSSTESSLSSSVADVVIDVLMGRERTRSVRATPEKVSEIVAFYAALMGGAPYPSLTVAALEDTVPGGHGPAQFVLINQPRAATPLNWARDPVSFPAVPDFFLAHEIAHQWWGQAVAGASYREQWISEGFAQYLAWCYVNATEGDEAGRRLMAEMRDSTQDLAGEGPVALGFRLGHLRGDRRIFRAIVYNKSAVVLHMLRRLIGDEAFTGGLRRLYDEHRFSLATTADVRAAFESGTSISLERFFARWIGDAGAPALKVSWSQPATDTLIVHVAQEGDPFDLPYDATITYADGRREVTRLRIVSAVSALSVPVRGPVRRVEFNDRTTIATVDDDGRLRQTPGTSSPTGRQ